MLPSRESGAKLMIISYICNPTNKFEKMIRLLTCNLICPVAFFLSAVVFLLASSSCLSARNCRHPDDIIGVYYVAHEGEESRVRVFRETDGTFSAQVLWIRDSLDRRGNLRLDEKNPDRSLRDIPCNRILIMKGLKFNSAKLRWDDGKIYDPTRGIRANVMCEFEPDGRLRVRGSLLGISQSVYWDKIGD